MRPATDPAPGDWIAGADQPWYVLATYGPPGLEAYARVDLAADDEYPWEIPEPVEDHVDPDRRRWELVVRTLGGFTSTPDHVHLAVWEGVGWYDVPGARFGTEGRTYGLMTGTLEGCLDRSTLSRPISFGQYEIPHLVWPEDRAWVISWDTDEENSYTVAGSVDAVDAVLDLEGLHGEKVPYGTPEDGWTW